MFPPSNGFCLGKVATNGCLKTIETEDGEIRSIATSSDRIKRDTYLAFDCGNQAFLIETKANHSTVQIALDDSSGFLPLSQETHCQSPPKQTLHRSDVHHCNDVPDHAE
jgi:hypothetical protein